MLKFTKLIYYTVCIGVWHFSLHKLEFDMFMFIT